MANYAKPIPVDKNGVPLQEFPTPVVALARVNTDNAAISSAISLDPNTTVVEVGAFGGQGAVIRWVPTTENASIAGAKGSVVSSGTGANFDHYVPPSAYRRFVVPRETQGGGTGAHQIGSTFGLYQRVARINAGIVASSVLVTEF